MVTVILILLTILVLSVATITTFSYVKRDDLHRWLIPYIKTRSQRGAAKYPVNLYVAVCNHFSPFYKGVSQEIAEHRVATWCREYPKFALQHCDSHGKYPIHTFFYNERDYNPRFMDSLCKLSKNGFADIEILACSTQGNPYNLKRRVEEFRDVLYHHHGLLEMSQQGEITFGYVHDNTHSYHTARSTDFSQLDLTDRSCALKSSGCYADFSNNYAPEFAQSSFFNSIFFTAASDKTTDTQYRINLARVNHWPESDLLTIQGPLALNWQNRVFGVLPKVENGELGYYRRFTPRRVALWLNSQIYVHGAENHLFLKLHTLGAVDCNVRYLLGEMGLHCLYHELENNYNDGSDYVLHYVSAREMHGKIRDICHKGALTDKNHHFF